MRWPRLLLPLFAATTVQADNGYLIGAGLEADDDNGFRGSLFAGLDVGEGTWLSSGIASSSIELPFDRSGDIVYADLEIDHFFNPLGISFGIGYWGDPDLLNSTDVRAAVRFRSGSWLVAGEYELRDFDFTIPPTDFFPGREITFAADGVGARLRYHFTDAFSMGVSGMQYDYSVDFRPDVERDAVRLVTISRLGLVNSLIDSRASLDFMFDIADRRWTLDFSTWDGALDRSTTDSVTVSYLHPASNRIDLEFSVGVDESDLYGRVTFASVFLYFYGG